MVEPLTLPFIQLPMSAMSYVCDLGIKFLTWVMGIGCTAGIALQHDIYVTADCVFSENTSSGFRNFRYYLRFGDIPCVETLDRKPDRGETRRKNPLKSTMAGGDGAFIST